MAERWLTYEEAGQLFGLSAEAMRKRSRRLGWKVQPPNDIQGKARVLVPDNADLHPGRPPGHPDAATSGHRPDELVMELRRRAEAAEAQVAELRDRAAKAEALAQERQDTVRHERERADRLERERDAARAELASWTAGGALERALRALMWRGQ
jgi:hypothetical protein